MTQQTLKNLLGEGKTAQVLAQLKQLTVADTDLHNQVLLIAARFAENEKAKHAGTLENDPLSIERNKINAALLAVMEQLPTNASEGVTQSHPLTTATTKTIIQNAEKIYNIQHIDNANFS